MADLHSIGIQPYVKWANQPGSKSLWTLKWMACVCLFSIDTNIAFGRNLYPLHPQTRYKRSDVDLLEWRKMGRVNRANETSLNYSTILKPQTISNRSPKNHIFDYFMFFIRIFSSQQFPRKKSRLNYSTICYTCFILGEPISTHTMDNRHTNNTINESTTRRKMSRTNEAQKTHFEWIPSM